MVPHDASTAAIFTTEVPAAVSACILTAAAAAPFLSSLASASPTSVRTTARPVLA